MRERGEGPKALSVIFFGTDVFRLWIGGELHPGSGVIATGNVQLHK
jgi:hypothetical protein